MPKKSFTYQAIACELTELCRYAYYKISCYGVLSRFSFKKSVRDLYSLRQLIMQSFSMDSNDWNNKGVNVSLISLFFELYGCKKYMFHVPELIYLLWGYWYFGYIAHSVEKTKYIIF